MPEFQLMGVALIFGAILFLAYVASRFVGKKVGASMQSKHMQVIEQISLGLDKRLILVRVGSEHFLFLAGKKEFRRVAKVNLSIEDTQTQTEEKLSNAPVFDFRQIFDKYMHDDRKKRMKNTRITSDTTQTVQHKEDVMQKNIHKLEQLREKGYDKEV